MPDPTLGLSGDSSQTTHVRCVVCGHTEDLASAKERWAFRPVADQWMCDECWNADRDFPEVDTLMRDCDEHCPDCGAERTAELVVRSSGERLHLYCTNPKVREEQVPVTGLGLRRGLAVKPYYQDDAVTIFHGDALATLRSMEANSVDAIVTDPPYKLSQEYSASTDADNLLAVSGIWAVAPELARVAKPGALAVVFYDTRILPLALSSFRDAGWKYLRALTLYRRWGNASIVGGWMSTSDFVLVFARPGGKPAFHGKTAHDVYVKAAPEADSTGHPAQKPLAFVRQIVERVTPEGGIVLDPYSGSGTTLLAANEASRRAVGIEIEKRYCEMAVRRLAQEVLDFGEAA